MEDESEIQKGKKVRVSTPSSDFQGTVSEYNEKRGYLTLNDAEEVYDIPTKYPSLDHVNEFRRKAGLVKIPIDKIHHYEFLEDKKNVKH